MSTERVAAILTERLCANYPTPHTVGHLPDHCLGCAVALAAQLAADDQT